MKDLLKRILFRKEILRYEGLEEAAKLAKEQYETLKAIVEEKTAARDKLTVADLVREKLAGYDMSLLSSVDDLPEALPEDERSGFLTDVHELAKNQALPVIIDHLIRDQLLYVGLEAENIERVNFGRASINGETLVRDEVARLNSLYLERHAKPEDFDPHDAI